MKKTVLLLIVTLNLKLITVNAQAPNYLWVRSPSGGGVALTFSQGITVDAAGNSFVTGYFKNGDAYFDGTTLANVGGADVFIIK
jgi:hypothetical protein